MKKSQDQNAVPVAEEGDAASAPSGNIDVDAIIAKVNVPANLRAIYAKAILSGMRIMFDKQSHAMMEQELAKPGPMPDKIAQGIIVLMYMLWTKSNKTLPPQIIVPVTFVLTLKAFDFLQKSGDQNATKEVLGDAVEKAVTGIMEKFGVKPDQVEQLARQYAGKAGGAAPPPDATAQPAGMLAQGGA